jgi:hypothetical protein
MTLAAIALLPSAALGEPVPCRVSATVPARAFVGEQIVLRIRILRRPDVSAAVWLSGPAFPGFRSDPLPGSSGEARVHEQGAAYLVFEERHALFAVRAGLLRIPVARLQCTLHTLPGRPATAFVATLAPAAVDAVALPAEGRPEGFSGLVGDIGIEVVVEPRTLTLGQSLHAEMSIEGEADLRDVPPPFGGAREISGAEIFAARPKLIVDPGDRLRLRRSFALDLVPRSTGVFVLPAIRVPFFDPRRRRYAIAASLPVEIRVDPPGGG